MKKMLLRGISLFLVLLMVYSSVPVPAFATMDLTETTETQTEILTEGETTEPTTEGGETEEPVEEELPEYSYAVNEDNTLVITAYNGEEKFVTIPATIDEMTVVAIGANAFANNTTILEVAIPEGVTEIGESAFAGCPQLRNVLVPESVATIFETSFEPTANLTILCFEKSYVHTFAKKQELGFKLITSAEESLVNETLNDTVTWRLNLVSGLLYFSGEGEIPNYSSDSATPWYSYASNLTGLVIDEGITKIGSNAFTDCAALQSFTIGEKVTQIGSGAFKGCKSLTSIIIPESVSTIGIGAFEGCVSLTTITIPDAVTAIEQWTLHKCENLETVVLGKNIKSFGHSVFNECPRLKTIYFCGTQTDWELITMWQGPPFVEMTNPQFENVTVYFYSETQPTEPGHYWHYVDGVPTPWET